MNQQQIEEIEIEVLLEAIRLRYDYDFKNYAKASLHRRIKNLLEKQGLQQPYQLIPQILYDKDIFNNFLLEMSVTVTELFRDPGFFKSIVNQVFTTLETYPYFKIWHAGCATGEEVYSLSILLQEAGLLERAKIYATDYNKRSLDIAEQGIYNAKNLPLQEQAYAKAGGKMALTNYYTHQYDAFKFKDNLKRNITFAYHNLVKDGVFGEMQMVICRNVLIYFDRSLQNQTLALFDKSLTRRGFLCLGSKESIDYSSINKQYEVVSKEHRVFRKNN